ncbi:MAG: endonuclease III [Desulfitobacteriaceae bacterium]
MSNQKTINGVQLSERVFPDLSLASQIFIILEKMFPNAHCELEYNSPLDLLVATILSAQCTDVRVNKVTRSLFTNLKNPFDYLRLCQSELEERIKSVGLYHSKAKNILAICQLLIQEYDGNVPEDFTSLLKLPGVGRKTANVVVSNAFGIPAIAVDTHVFRVANRLGLVVSKTPDNVEKQLMEIFSPDQWSNLHHYLIFLGRRICVARKPHCSECQLNKLCTMYNA